MQTKSNTFIDLWEQMLWASIWGKQTDWEMKLPAALLAYRTSVHNTTKMTPFFLNHGREARLPIDIIFPIHI